MSSKYLGEIESSRLSKKSQNEFAGTDDSLIVFARESGRGWKLTFVDKNLEDLFWIQTPYQWYKVVNG